MRKAVVVGAGVVGVATAYLLCRDGYEVTLIDANQGPALGASRANGAQLSYAYGDALASPGMIRHLPEILLGRDPAYRVKLQVDPEFLIWGLRFLINGTSGRFLANTAFLLQMAAATQKLLAELLAEFDIRFRFSSSGKMILYGTEEALAATEKTRQLKASLGVRQEVLDRPRASAIEPALHLYPDRIARVIYSPDDAAGRPDLFCTELIAVLKQRYSLQTIFGHRVQGIINEKGRVLGVGFADREPVRGDIVAVTTGLGTKLLPRLDRPIGALWPVQGYSMTASATERAMKTSITDLKRKIVFARLGGEVRMAGLADIGPWEARFDHERFETFRTAAVAAFGGAFSDLVEAPIGTWSGGRPCTPSSRPIIRRGSLDGLFLNLGHGTLGWTLCLGSASALMDLIRSS